MDFVTGRRYTVIAAIRSESFCVTYVANILRVTLSLDIRYPVNSAARLSARVG